VEGTASDGDLTLVLPVAPGGSQIINAADGPHTIELIPGRYQRCGDVTQAAGYTSSSRLSKVSSEAPARATYEYGRATGLSQRDMVHAVGTVLGELIAHELAHQLLWDAPENRPPYMDQETDPTTLDYFAEDLGSFLPSIMAGPRLFRAPVRDAIVRATR
jgi:hypothetical protein